MRKSKTETAETRKRIVETASTEFRRNGFEGTGLADELVLDQVEESHGVLQWKRGLKGSGGVGGCARAGGAPRA